MREGTLLNSLGACAIILLVWRPADLFTASFQLTFMSVGAIVACAFPLIEKLRLIGNWTPNSAMPFPARVPRWLKRFCETLYWREGAWEIDRKRHVWSANLFKSPYLKWLEARGIQGIAAYIFEGILVSLIVQVWLLPILVLYFNRFSFASIVLNLWVGFFLALESFSAVIALFFAQINGALALPLIKLTEVFNWLLLSVPGIFVENDWASVRPATYSGPVRAVYFLYFLPVLVLAIAVNRWSPFHYAPQPESRAWRLPKLAGWALSILSFLIIFHPFSAPRPDGKLHIDFLDVGQGDSTLVTFPDGQTLLIDGGGAAIQKTVVEREGEEAEVFEPDQVRVGEGVVSAFLWEKGYSKVDYILATHADLDHMQGLTDIAKNFRVRSALVARAPIKDEDFAEFSAVLQKRGVPVVNIARGDTIEFEGVKIEVLYPAPDDSPEAAWDNNHSIVLRITYGEQAFLFTGDIESATERELLRDPGLLRADVVKVPHHGSRTSSTPDFVTATAAKHAIIPVGRASRFGHPSKEVVERWLNSGAKVITTGERGTISVVTDGRELKLTTFLP
jgi:competence protein ComEC